MPGAMTGDMPGTTRIAHTIGIIAVITGALMYKAAFLSIFPYRLLRRYHLYPRILYYPVKTGNVL